MPVAPCFLPKFQAPSRCHLTCGPGCPAKGARAGIQPQIAKIWSLRHMYHMTYYVMVWQVRFHDEFELQELPEEIQDELLARLKVLSEFGPQLGRPNVDTLNGSSFPNMKELRFRKDGLWRFAFAFDSLQQAIVLVGGDKEGENQTRFYKSLVKVADARFSDHLRKIKSTLKKDK
ncbi:type II toxin-antitoxin system RelE/ParE family toxin [Bradyrhizobium sp.]|uniref:type II toxin-antitoxin system RelE/ParE family toxin n=1 Tax=Bradyrhizobium sp. TaxID=376 RepID=UPI00351F33B6